MSIHECLSLPPEDRSIALWLQSEESPGRKGRRAVESTGSRKVRVGVTENNRPNHLG